MKLPNVYLREICVNDHHKDFFHVLGQLFEIKRIPSFDEFKNTLDQILSENSHIYVYEFNGRIIATGKIIIESKLHGVTMGHIEDVVCDQEYRNRGLGKMIINKLIEVGMDHHCYKIVLNCNDQNVEFYEKCGFINKGNEMSLYFI